VADGGTLQPQEYFDTGALNALWRKAESEALKLTLGDAADNDILHRRVAGSKRSGDPLILIGGPPCQAYSVVGRARNTKVSSFRTRGDERHFLYRQYLEILAKYSPDAFIMENVKGMLTSKVGGANMFDQIYRDLSNPVGALGGQSPRFGRGSEYLLLPVHVDQGYLRDADAAEQDPKRFVIRCEEHGVPQARHRVIIMGVRSDHAAKAIAAPGLASHERYVTVSDALSGLPKLRSGLTNADDAPKVWLRAIERQRKLVAKSVRRSESDVKEHIDGLRFDELPRSGSFYSGCDPSHLPSIRCPDQDVVLNHTTRSHMASDLGRYLYGATFGMLRGRSPTSDEFPRQLAPEHANWESGSFADRFRAQLQDAPSTTVTSHLSKDGHAFIHFDPLQCRSLTVREAARLQTFPDDYLFLGSRTQQFVQVGNAVPPMIAGQIASVVWSILGEK
jgi:DNA (cytosine-5)-methyltransferase 1